MSEVTKLKELDAIPNSVETKSEPIQGSIEGMLGWMQKTSRLLVDFVINELLETLQIVSTVQ